MDSEISDGKVTKERAVSVKMGDYRLSIIDPHFPLSSFSLQAPSLRSHSSEPVRKLDCSW